MADAYGMSRSIDSLMRLVRSPRMQDARKGISSLPNLGGPFNPGGIARLLGGLGGGGNNQPTGFGRAGASIGNTIGNVLGALNGGGQQQQPENPMLGLWQQLLGNLSSDVDMPTGIDTADLMAQVKGAIDPIYDQRINEARGEYGRGSKDIQGMYQQLSDQYLDLVPEQQAQAAEAREQIQDLYGTLRSNIEGTYSKVSEEQGDLFKQLGIEEALPDVLADQNGAVLDASRAASENQAQQEQRYMDIGDMDATYMRQGAPLAKMTGNELSSNLLFQLNNYVNQANAERSSAIQSRYMDQLTNAQGMLQNQQQMAMQEKARRESMLFEILNAQMNQKQQPLTADSFMAGLDPRQQNSVAGAFTSLQRSPEMIYGKVEDPRSPVPGTFVETTPEWQMAQVDEMLRRGDIDPQTHQLLLMYLQLQEQGGQ